MEYNFEIFYATGETETGVTVAFDMAEAIENIIDTEDIEEIEGIRFSYTKRVSAFFDKEDIFNAIFK